MTAAKSRITLSKQFAFLQKVIADVAQLYYGGQKGEHMLSYCSAHENMRSRRGHRGSWRQKRPRGGPRRP